MERKTLLASGLVAIYLAGCAYTPTTEQMQNLDTESFQIPVGFARSAIESGACTALSEHRLQGKVGLTLGHDLQLLADQIDSVVTYNGGNSYMLHSWEWVFVSSDATAPLVEISVLDCTSTGSSIESDDQLDT